MSVVSVAGLQGFRSGPPVTAGWVSCSMMGRVRLVVSRLHRYRHRPRLALHSYGPAVTGPVFARSLDGSRACRERRRSGPACAAAAKGHPGDR